MRAIRWRRAAARYVWPLACCALAACGSGDGFVGSGGAVGPLAPNFDSIQANVFEPLCEHCHSGANAPAGLRLDAANSYVSLVGVAEPRAAEPAARRARRREQQLPDPEARRHGRASASACRPACRLCRKPTSTSFGSGSATARSRSRRPRDRSASLRCRRRRARRTLALPGSITVGFDREVNAPSVNDGIVHVAARRARRAARHGRRRRDHARVRDACRARTRARPSWISRACRSCSTATASRSLGTGGAAILDLSGNALDGESDGVAGGDFTATFSVAQ